MTIQTPSGQRAPERRLPDDSSLIELFVVIAVIPIISSPSHSVPSLSRRPYA
jgi:hypothetical protein